MAQIKVLDLCNSNSLSELSYEDAIKINGGAAFGSVGALGGLLNSYYSGLGLRDLQTYQNILGGATIGAFGGVRGGLWGASLSS